MKPIVLPILVMTKDQAQLKSLGIDSSITHFEDMVFYNINAIAISGKDIEMTEIWVNGKILYCPLNIIEVRKKIEE